MSKRTTDIPIAVMLTPFRGLLVWQPQPLLQQRKCLMTSVGVPAPYSGRCFGVHVWWLGKKTLHGTTSPLVYAQPSSLTTNWSLEYGVTGKIPWATNHQHIHNWPTHGGVCSSPTPAAWEGGPVGGGGLKRFLHFGGIFEFPISF